MKITKESLYIIIMYCALISLGLPSKLSAQDERVSLKDKRENTLSNADAILNPGDPELLERFNKGRNPFEPYVEPQKDKPKIVVRKTQERLLSDKIVLQKVANSLKPKGSLILGKKRILILENGAKLQEGNVIPAKMRGKTYNVKISEITGRDFTLSLNQSKITSSFMEARSKGRVTRDSSLN